MPERLSEEGIERGLSALPRWTRNGDALSRRVMCDDFRHAMLFLNAVAYFAEQADHHPEIHNVYRTVTLTTHDAGGLTAKDFDLARKIDSLL
ncbi:4a-hydroxytetrahydrobiopterin dehydratase [Candidatus Poribacteria bacterium]|jgi:4a-hydroxytetrahydrobiopterin dehydratase|nr:4a-hydroxytetrahydrobiopterin dehydratase [Candidatus Poribacteria bacterium]MBT5537158.1 4a-hydroxytetrahydrobiopterin dehydratase [Candidatus Poribacteria bacterium]MBT5710984.1 4a-hydroxytetrahydrobiopterin dehydratase [Candidatus Poribacteria bacterium]MBT7096071.1 4a-hydroxytetrahydrobiopterin dehydratase [Candidatus Poribacteria bacterium]MBT7804978.1 4a-hydroxytetrahydrobiopterin dehydratase [Candidatus Poribacteria bacterium]